MKTSTILNIFIILLVVGIAGAGYYFFTGQGGSALLSSESANASPETVAGRDFLNLLVSLRSLRLDDSVFSDTSFTSLKDFSVELKPQPRGRNNPFLPIGLGGDSTPSSPASAATTSAATIGTGVK
jgi:hypothetical protein